MIINKQINLNYIKKYNYNFDNLSNKTFAKSMRLN